MNRNRVNRGTSWVGRVTGLIIIAIIATIVILGVNSLRDRGGEQTTQVVTLDATEISSLFATLNGELSDLGEASSVEVYFQWGESPGSYTHETPKQTKTSPGRFSAQITGPMMIGNTYYFRARAGTTAQGSEKNFYVP